ncbi:hypothetical protein SETIT_3G363100v2 [Setaria italica]|uniref:Uncharacterized protein n=1 Tax=Setaria italica TaxID=4555 RepID=A0A368QMG9_SETIT|nr:hypothetical protein SETIT_3G363100v2 [Setaria italica]
MQRAFMTWRDLQVPSGLGLDKHTGGVVADSTFLVADEEETSAGAAQTSTAKPPPFLDELYTLFGHTTQARGTLLTTGGVREATPSVGTQDNPADRHLDPCLLAVLVTCLKGQPGTKLLTVLRKRKVATWWTMLENSPKLWL